VHRDLKPDNLFLCERDDGALFVKIVDFGISKLLATGMLDTLTRRGTVLGTAYYMSPEQAQAFADVDGRADLFSVGAILFECLSGRPPHTGASYEAVLIAICTKDAEDVRNLEPGVPEELSLTIQKALARDRDQRFHSAEEFLAALTAFAPGALDVVDSSARPRTSEVVMGPDAPALSNTSRMQEGRQRLRSWIAGGAAVLLGFALTALWMGNRRPAPERASGLEPAGTLTASAPLPSGGARSPTPEPLESALPVPAALAATTPSASSGPSPSSKPASARKRPSAMPANSGKPRSAVAPGLELITREP
jgi:eukaryotic-like serine/threonine-protein kinase